MCQMSGVLCHVSVVSSFFWGGMGGSGRASRGRICYQGDLVLVPALAGMMEAAAGDAYSKYLPPQPASPVHYFTDLVYPGLIHTTLINSLIQ